MVDLCICALWQERYQSKLWHNNKQHCLQINLSTELVTTFEENMIELEKIQRGNMKLFKVI